MTLAYILGGLVLLGIGGEFVVRGSVAAAVALRASTVIIGVVLMGFGTSLPELVTSLESALSGAPGLALGNVVGSNIANVLLIAGTAALIAGSPVSRLLLMRDGMAMLAATVALAVLVALDAISAFAGVIMLGVLVLYLSLAVLGLMGGGGPAPEIEEAAEEAVEEAQEVVGAAPGIAIFRALIVFAVGLGATLVGARLLVDGSTALARELGVSDALIGATIVAVGTSLPELAATIAAALRRHAEMAIGNVIGSNIFNVCAIIGVTSLAAPLPAPPSLAAFDIWAMVGASVLMLVFAYAGARLSRADGFVLLSAYFLYIVTAIEFST